MRKPILGGLVVATLCGGLLAQVDSAAQQTPSIVPEGRGLPGQRVDTERWIVHFKTRSFDLAPLRAAIYGRLDAGEVNAVVADIEKKMVADQRAFVTRVQRDLNATVVAQWWLVNALALELPFANVAALRKLPNVDFVEPDREHRIVIRKATDSRNHNADYVQNVLKIDGSGVAVGIMDTGQDERMGSLSRPHRMYFVNGDLNNTSGSGIGGTRLVVNRQIGALGADDPQGHGTGVASIAAGAAWGTSASDNGHAFGANIAGYAIANAVQGGASNSTTMTNAWQAMVRDRATYNIVAANLSYGGSPSLTNVAQKAIDSASLNGDILCCTAAGNSGSSTRGSQSNLNGLAVAAINADSHTVASFSSRGPLSGSSRFFPDISGCGVSTVMARRNSETSNYTGSGTSMASPQVCGTAALVRAANKNLTALETKAILLATTASIAAQNPSRDRNAYGLGMLRSDLAVDLARSSSGFGSNTIDAQNRTRRIQLNVVKDKQYAVVVTWHRTNVDSTSYSNLAIRVLDGTSTIGSSNTPLNVYESVRFLAKKTGTFTLEVTSPSLSGNSQTFAYAFSEAPRAPIAGSITAFGAGCKGTGTPSSNCQSMNEQATFRSSSSFAGVTYAVEVTANQTMVVEGYEMPNRVSSGGAQTLVTRLYDADAQGRPNRILASGTVTVGSALQWYRTTFSQPVTVQRGQRFFIALVNGNPTTHLGTMNSGTPVPYFRNNGTGGAWTSRLTTLAWAYRINCRTTGTGAVPVLSAGGQPDVGARVSLQVQRAAPSTGVLLLVGASKTQWAGVPLPWTLPGAPGCQALVSGDWIFNLRSNAQGSASLGVTIPTDKTLIGNAYFTQAAVIDPRANAFGIATSNAVEFRVGGTP